MPQHARERFDEDELPWLIGAKYSVALQTIFESRENPFIELPGLPWPRGALSG
jgi:hypothetical protein